MPSRKDTAEFQRCWWRSILVAALVVMLVRSVKAQTPTPPQTQTQTQAPAPTMSPPPGESTGKTEGNVFYLANCLLNFPAYFVILTRRFQFGIVRRSSNLLFNFTRYIVSSAFCRVPDAWFHNCASSGGRHLNSTGVECDPRTRYLELLTVPCDTDFDLLRFRLLTLRHAHGQNPVVIVGANTLSVDRVG